MVEWESRGEGTTDYSKVDNVMGKNESNLKNGATDWDFQAQGSQLHQTLLSPWRTQGTSNHSSEASTLKKMISVSYGVKFHYSMGRQGKRRIASSDRLVLNASQLHLTLQQVGWRPWDGNWWRAGAEENENENILTVIVKSWRKKKQGY